MQDLSQRLRLQQLTHRSAFQLPEPDELSWVSGYDRSTGTYAVRTNRGTVRAEPMQISGLPVGKQVDLQGRKFDYL